MLQSVPIQRSRRSVRSLGLVALGLALATGCGAGSPHDPRRVPLGYPTTLVDPGTVEGDWAFDHEVTITHAEGSHTFRAALEKSGRGLTLVALSPQGIRAFALTQTGRHVTFTPFVDFSMPFPPEYIMHDVNRLWLWSSAPPDGGSGERSFERDGEQIIERWSGGRVRERRFSRIDGTPRGAIVATYPEGLAPNAPMLTPPPDSARLENGWFGYRVDARTLDWGRL